MCKEAVVMTWVPKQCGYLGRREKHIRMTNDSSPATPVERPKTTYLFKKRNRGTSLLVIAVIHTNSSNFRRENKKARRDSCMGKGVSINSRCESDGEYGLLGTRVEIHHSYGHTVAHDSTRCAIQMVALRSHDPTMNSTLDSRQQNAFPPSFYCGLRSSMVS